MKRIAVVIAFEGFRDEELFVPYSGLSEEFDVKVFSSKKGLATGKLGGTFMVNNVIEDIVPEDFDALILVGGPGGYSYLDNLTLKEIINNFYSSNRLVSAICMAPLLLAGAGILDGKKATVFHGDAEKIKMNKGVIYTAREVEVDGNIITADGALAAQSFTKNIREYLNG